MRKSEPSCLLHWIRRASEAETMATQHLLLPAPSTRYDFACVQFPLVDSRLCALGRQGAQGQMTGESDSAS